MTLSLLVLFAVVPVHAATPPPKVGANIDITLFNDLNNRQQAEPTIAVHPLKPNILVGGAQEYRLLDSGGHRWHGYYRSTDGGQSWSVSLVPGFPGDNSPQGLSSPLHGFDLTSDPVLAFDRVGNVYYVGIALDFNSAGNIVRFAGFVARYVNDGADFAGVTLIPTAGDKPWIAVDASGGTNDGNVYLIYFGRFKNLSGPLFVRSTDGGMTFSEPVQITPDVTSGITVDGSGNIYAAATDFVNISAIKSSDGGLSFSAPVVAASGITPLFEVPGNRFRVFTFPQIAADALGIYIVWDDVRSGDSDVLLVRSMDGGSTWSSPARMNDVGTNHQFFPSVAAAGGKVTVVWYDSRLGQLPNGTITALDVFFTRSVDGGASFSKNVRVTSVSFDPNLVLRNDFAGAGSPFIGDYIQVAASPTEAHPIWTDNRNACNSVDPLVGCTDQDAFTSTIKI